MNGNISIEFHQDIGGVDVLLESAEWPCVPRVGETVGIRMKLGGGELGRMTVLDVLWGWRVTGTGERIEEECVVIVALGPARNEANGV